MLKACMHAFENHHDDARLCTVFVLLLFNLANLDVVDVIVLISHKRRRNTTTR